MSEQESKWDWVVVVLFFAIGVSVGLLAAGDSMERGRSVGESILFGSCFGFMAAYVAFGVTHLLHLGVRGIRRKIQGLRKHLT